MQIIGWVRVGDKAACGGTVIEGSEEVISYGRGYTFQGARMACPRNCVIAEGYARATLSNGRCQVHHGQRTSGLCPLLSSLNDIDGIGDEGRIGSTYYLNAREVWTGIKAPEPHEEPYDEQPRLLAAPIEGVPYYIETLDGRRFSGRAPAGGLLPRVDTYGEDEYAVYWGDEALAKMNGAEA